MRAIGYVLITGGFLGGAYLCSLDPERVATGPFLASLAVGVLGVVAVRVALHRSARHEDHLTTNIQAIEESLASLAQKAAELDAAKESFDVYDLRHRIDDDFLDDLGAFVEARETIAVSHGLAAYAEVMNHFAAAERYLRRVWSASTDGYVDEAHAYLVKAKNQFAAALETFRGLG